MDGKGKERPATQRIRRYHHRTMWSEDEVTALQEQWPDVPAHEIADALGRPYSSVLSKARQLGLSGQGYHPTRWTAGQEEYLMAHWGQLSARQIASVIGRTEEACTVRASVLGITRNMEHNWYVQALIERDIEAHRAKQGENDGPEQ